MNVEDYLEALPEDRKNTLSRLREVILENLPDVNEGIEYKMPAYWLDEKLLLSMASQKHFMALYVMPYDDLLPFAGELETYDMGKSCIRFKKLEEKDLDLFAKIIRYVGRDKE